jgi:hypothetical protein
VYDFQEDDAPPPPKQRQRAKKADPSKWKRNNRQRKAPKDIGPCACALKCFLQVRASARDETRRMFQAKSRSEQQNYLAGLIDVNRRKARRGPAMSIRRREARKFECVYFLMVGAQRSHVCKHAFKSILGVQDTRLRNLNKKRLTKACIEDDGRGKHAGHRRIAAAVTEQIDAHISSFPTEPSHYVLHRVEEFLDMELSVRKMWHLYLEKHEPAVHSGMGLDVDAEEEEEEEEEEDEAKDEDMVTKPTVTYQRYLDHFHATGLRFGKLRLDTCGACDQFVLQAKGAEDDEEKQRIHALHQEHLTMADLAYKMRAQDLNTALDDGGLKPVDLPLPLRSVRGVETICSDYMGNLCVPKLSAGESYYKRKLKLFNYGIHVASLDQHQMYFYDEKEGRKTSNDILSAVHANFTNRATGREACHWWADNTKAQVKTWKTVRYVHALTHPEGLYHFKRLDQLYPPVGHTLLPNDVGFGGISRAAKRRPMIPTSKAYMAVAQKASTANPHNCVWFDREKHRDVSGYLSQWYNCKKRGYVNTDGDQVLLDTVRWFNYGIGEEGEHGELVSHPAEVWYRHSFDPAEPWKKIAIERRPCARPKPLAHPSFTLYTEPLEVDPKKVKDLHSLAVKFLAPKYHALYPAPVVAAGSGADSSEEEQKE